MASKKRSGFESSGFFAWRTPLLPFDALLRWAEGLGACAAAADRGAALAADRRLLRQRLFELLETPAVREALFVASPELEGEIDRWAGDPQGKRGQKIERALVRYVVRMAARPTPFGLFAGNSVGQLARFTDLALEGRASWSKHCRLDMDYLCALVDAVVADPAVAAELTFRPSSSLYRAVGQLKVIQARIDPASRRRRYKRVSFALTDPIEQTLARAEAGRSIDALARGLVEDDPEVSLAEAEGFVGQLVDNQILRPTVQVPLTGQRPIEHLIAQLHTPRLEPVRRQLRKTRDALQRIEQQGIGSAPSEYRSVARDLEALAAPVKLSRLFQVDTTKPTPRATLGRGPLAELTKGVAILQRLAGRDDHLDLFRRAFVERFGDREVPLVEALDEEIGLRFGRSSPPELPPRFAGLQLTGVAAQDVPRAQRDAFLSRLLARSLAGAKRIVTLTDRDLDAIASSEPPPLPDAFSVFATLVASSTAAIAAGDYQILLQGASGPSGARLLGRFCDADPQLSERVASHLRAEERLAPQTAFAELVHLPEARTGNILFRPVLRQWEVPFLGHSTAPRARQLPITDLQLSVAGDRLQLRSRTLGCPLAIRLTNAHNYWTRGLPLYRFLGQLQHQGSATGLGWSWGPLRFAPFLPRVTVGRLVLSTARWTLVRESLAPIARARGDARFEAVQALRRQLEWPRWIVLRDPEEALVVDLDNALGVETFAQLLGSRGWAAVEELFPGPEALCAHDDGGRFAHELIVPFVRRVAEEQPFAPEPPARERRDPISADCRPAAPRRSFAPGSEWLYAKLYCGSQTADLLLRDLIRPLVAEVQSGGWAERWFFVRYGDPERHLRLRFCGRAAALQTEVLPRLQQAAASWLQRGAIWRLQLDTYEREVERYGGTTVGIELAERLFCADSEAVLALADELCAGDLDRRWDLTLCGVDLLLRDLRLDPPSRLALLQRARRAFGEEFGVDARSGRQLGQAYRGQAARIDELLTAEGGAPADRGLASLRRRSAALQPIVDALLAAESSGELGVSLFDLAASFVHMHANRMLRSSARAQELVLYDFLARRYRTQLATAASHDRG